MDVLEIAHVRVGSNLDGSFILTRAPMPSETIDYKSRPDPWLDIVRAWSRVDFTDLTDEEKELQAEVRSPINISFSCLTTFVTK